MSARVSSFRIVAVGIVGLALASPLGAQQRIPPNQPAGPRFMVPVLESTEGKLGAQLAEILRNRMIGEIPGKTLWIIPSADIVTALTSSGYPTDQALSVADTRALAGAVRAEEYVEGRVSRTATGYRIDAVFKLMRGDAMVQPLPPVEAAKLDKAAEKLSDEVQNARKQIVHATRCMDLRRGQAYTEAARAAREGIRVYPPSTMARLCRLEIAAAQKLPPDSIIAQAEELLGIDAANRRALALAADAYDAKGMQEKYIATLQALLATDPASVRLVETVVTALAVAGQPEKARPIIDEAVSRNPGELALLRLQWRVHLALKEYKSAAAIGESIIAADSAAADSSFTPALAAVHLAAGDTVKASALLTLGVARFPKQTTLLLMLAQVERQQGRLAEAVGRLERVVGIDPNIDGVWLQLARAQMEANVPADSIFYSLRRAKAAGDSAALVGAYAVTVGNSIYRRAVTNRTIDDLRRAIAVLAWADSTSASVNAKFLLGLSYQSLGQLLLPQRGPSPSCADAREATDAFTQALIFVRYGGPSFPQQTAQAMERLQALLPYAERIQKTACK